MFLYARMFVTMLFGIYTSRIVLEALGETNFGIYNVVGGINNSEFPKCYIGCKYAAVYKHVFRRTFSQLYKRCIQRSY